MIKYFCDICGKDITDEVCYEVQIYAKRNFRFGKSIQKPFNALICSICKYNIEGDFTSPNLEKPKKETKKE